MRVLPHDPTRSFFAFVHRVGSCLFYRMIPRDRLWHQFIAWDHAWVIAWSHAILFGVHSSRGIMWVLPHDPTPSSLPYGDPMASYVFYRMIPATVFGVSSSRGIMRVIPHGPTRSSLALVHRVGSCEFYCMIPRDRLYRMVIPWQHTCFTAWSQAIIFCVSLSRGIMCILPHDPTRSSLEWVHRVGSRVF